MLANIPEKKRSKSDFQKVWQGILIGYSPDTTKHFRVWALQTKQVIIASEPYINESEKGAKLLKKWPVETSLKRKALAEEPRPRGCQQKRFTEELVMQPVVLLKGNNNMETILSDKHKTVMSITESSSKIHEPAAYNEVISNLIHGRRWRETIEEELQNLENYYTWEYKQLPPDHKTIRSKWVFKVKFNTDGLVSRFKARLVAQGFLQVQGINLTEMFAPTVRRKSLRIYLAICLALNLIIHQVDVVSAYLKSLLDDNKYPIFMKLSLRIHELRQVRERLLCRLLRSLYSLRQSGKL